MPEVKLRLLNANQPAAWEEPLRSAATFTALDAWSQLVHQTYGYTIYRFEAVEDEKVTGVLVLAHIRHPIFGNYLTTLPFVHRRRAMLCWRALANFPMICG
jgi:hypothetical protein